MSKWRLELDVAFDTERECVAFANLMEELKHKVWIWADHSVQFDTETSCRYHKCFHDEIPAKPCGDYVNIDFSKVTKVEHKDLTETKIDPQTLIDEANTQFELTP